jgi:hypothetical protein
MADSKDEQKVYLKANDGVPKPYRTFPIVALRFAQVRRKRILTSSQPAR